MTASSSSELHMAPCVTLPFDWQTPSKWFCLLHALHVWPHAGHIRGRSPDPVLPCWKLLQPLHALRWGCISVMFLLRLLVAVGRIMFWARFCWRYADIWSLVMSEMPDILFWSCNAISNAWAWLTFCSRVFSDPALANKSACRASLAIPRMNWSLTYMLDKSWSQLGHIKLQSLAPDFS